MLNAILYWLNTGIPWRDLPERFGAWQSVYSWFRVWTKAGVWEDILTALIVQDLVEETTLMLDSTTIKARQHASGVKKGDTTRKLDGAEGGLTTKVHYSELFIFARGLIKFLSCSDSWLKGCLLFSFTQIFGGSIPRQGPADLVNIS